MRAIVFASIIVLIAPASLLATVLIKVEARPSGDEFIISFDSWTEPNLVRAFALDIRTDNDANIIEVTALNPDYYIHPGTMQFDVQGNIIDYGTPVAENNDLPGDTLPGLDSNGVTLVLASLYAPVGPGSPNAPNTYGPLVSILVDKSCCLTISPNVSRAGPTGVVMENHDEVVEVYFDDPCPAPLQKCLKYTAPEYAAWEFWGKPDCWCYRKQCRGDVNGSSFLGKPVSLADLSNFRMPFGVTDTYLRTIPNGICADLNHAAFLGKRITLADLNIFKAYFNLPDANVPCCDIDGDCVLTIDDNYNYWTD
jgi:hypothetical protein